MMSKSIYFKYAVFVIFSIVSPLGNATVEIIFPVVNFPNGPFGFGGREIPEPVEAIKRYSLAIDAEKSYFKVEDNPYVFNGSSVEPVKYSISGGVGIFERNEKYESYTLNETKITALEVESAFNSIDLSSTYYWDENYVIRDDFAGDPFSNVICACIVMVNFDAPYINGEFDGQFLELNGGGFFKEDEVDGVFGLELTSGGATHQISYHIEASVVSSVPVPAAIYFFFTGVAGLVLTRKRYSI